MLVDLIRVPEPTCIDDMLDEPFGLLMLGASLEKAGYEVRITNLAGCDYESWKSKIKPADMYGIQLNTPTAPLGIKIAEYIKQKYPGTPVICGGSHVSAIEDFCELMVFDTIVMGEGDREIVDLATEHGAGIQLRKFVCARHIGDLDTLPFPARNLVDMDAFHRKVDGKRCFGIIGSRGCCFKCAFCDRTLFGEKIRYRSIDNIVAEIKHIIKEYGVRNFEMFDDMFTFHKGRVREFVEKTKGLKISYRCNSRSDMLDPSIYRMLRDSGCKMICFGIESGSQRLLNAMSKGTTVERNHKAISIARQAGITTAGYFILGFPGETKETINETKEFILRSGIDHAQVYTFIPLPGCDVYRNPSKYGMKIISKDYSDYYLVTGNDGRGGKIIETEHLSADELQEEVVKFRQFLKEYGSRGEVQDYYKDKLKYKDRNAAK